MDGGTGKCTFCCPGKFVQVLVNYCYFCVLCYLSQMSFSFRTLSEVGDLFRIMCVARASCAPGWQSICFRLSMISGSLATWESPMISMDLLGWRSQLVHLLPLCSCLLNLLVSMGYLWFSKVLSAICIGVHGAHCSCCSLYLFCWVTVRDFTFDVVGCVLGLFGGILWSELGGFGFCYSFWVSAWSLFTCMPPCAAVWLWFVGVRFRLW